jgi:hypothetical protein
MKIQNEKLTRCMICGGDELVARLMDRGFQVMACTHCGLAWKLGDSREKPADSAGSALMPDFSLSEMEEISLYRRPPGVLLNVGRHSSDMLETARMYGFRPLTLPKLEECTEPTAAHSRRRVADDQPTYDVIRLDGALENDPDPRSLLQRAACLMGEKGLLVVSSSDLSRWEAPLYGEGASLMPPDLPRWFFSPHALETLLTQCGWKVLKISTYDVHQQPFAFGPSQDQAVPPQPGALMPVFNTFPTQMVSRFRILARRLELRAPLELVERARQPREERVPAGLEL